MSGNSTISTRPPRTFSPRRLADARRAKGLKQREMAERIGHFLQHYQRYEYGLRNPSTATLPKLADALGVTIDSLFTTPEE